MLCTTYTGAYDIAPHVQCSGYVQSTVIFTFMMLDGKLRKSRL
jgi:hypothetical protein